MIDYRRRPAIDNQTLNRLMALAWDNREAQDFQSVLAHSLTWIGAYASERLVGFVNVAWDGGVHAFLLDTTVHPYYRRRGVGTQLIKEAAEAALDEAPALEWLHVDSNETLMEKLYYPAGFEPTDAGVMGLAELRRARPRPGRLASGRSQR